MDHHDTANETLLPTINVLWRIGYRETPEKVVHRTSSPPTTNTSTTNPSDDTPNTSQSLFKKNDPIYSQEQQQQYQAYLQRRQQEFTSHTHDVVVPTPDTTTVAELRHNLSPDYIRHLLLGHAPTSASPPRSVTTDLTHHDDDDDDDDETFRLAPLLQLKRDFPRAIRLIIMLHNPETQYARYYLGRGNNISHPPTDDYHRTVADFLETTLYESFVTLQAICDNDDQNSSSNNNDKAGPPLLDGYGVVSNGLSLPGTHPMHVPFASIGRAAQRVSNTRAHFYAIQLPANALETNGIQVAQQIQQWKHDDILQCQNSNNKNKNGPNGETSPTTTSHLAHLNVLAMRPLKCYSDGGTGSNTTRLRTRPYRSDDPDDVLPSLMRQAAQFPFMLVDYPVTPNVDREQHVTTTSTNDMTQPPVSYNVAYQRAVQLFDGHEILERQAERKYAAQQANRENKTPVNQALVDPSPGDGSVVGDDYLTEEERDTLHGCRMLEEMIHNCHAVLQQARCIQIHEMLLSQYVLPILSGQFVSLDEQTSQILEAYFSAYGPTLQYYVARNTRQLLVRGDNHVDDTTKGPDDNDQVVASSPLSPPRYDHVPITQRLQEFGLELLWQQHYIPPEGDHMVTTDGSSQQQQRPVPIFDTVMVGMTTVEEVVDTMTIAQQQQQQTHLSSSFHDETE